MPARTESARDSHTQVILDYYASKRGIEVHGTAPEDLVDRYLSKVMLPDELAGKVILEIGAGCSQYIPVFLGNGCKRYYANDLIPERLAVARVDDPRYKELSGDFRSIEVPEPVDIVFANLVMMYLIPKLDEFVEAIGHQLDHGGRFLSMDSNYLCPLSVLRRVKESRHGIPARLFSPFRYADTFRRHGFEVEKLVPFTAPLPWTTGNWLLGTTFWLRARKVRRGYGRTE